MFEGLVGVCAVVSVGLPVGVAGSVGSVVGQLAEAAGSPGAMALLAAVDPALLSSSERVDLVRAWERQLSWVASCQLPVVAALELADGHGLPEAWSLPDAAREERGPCDVQAVAVEAMVLAAAGTQTPAELGLPDRMGGVWAELAAEDMETVLTGLDAEATRIGAALHAVNAAEVPVCWRGVPMLWCCGAVGAAGGAGVGRPGCRDGARASSAHPAWRCDPARRRRRAG